MGIGDSLFDVHVVEIFYLIIVCFCPFCCVVRVTCVGVQGGVNDFRAYAWVAAGSDRLWYGWKLTHQTRRSLYVSVWGTMIWCSSIAWRYRAVVALGASLDIFSIGQFWYSSQLPEQ